MTGEHRVPRLAVMLVWGLSTCSASVHAKDVTVAGRQFSIPDDTRLHLVADTPLVDRPICADLDEAGRLYVADSSGSNDPVQKQLEERPHRIVCLEDTDGDGTYDRSTVFADRMMFPEGAMWHAGSLYVSAPPSIWKLTDTDGDGVADTREEWFEGKTLTGCANDLHGPYLGPDGWIYWCKGAFAEQTYERPGEKPFVTRAAHIFRRRPEGGPVEAVMTGGMDNPVEVVFTPDGERIFTTTFLQHPGGGRRDGLIHAIYGGVYGKIHSVLDGHPRTGPVMPVLSHLDAAAPCGLARLRSDYLAPQYRTNVIACLFNMHKLTRHQLSVVGAELRSETSDFVSSPDLDFHPTDVLEDADGSLIIVDTGGWYKLCCPTSQLWKPDVLGGIYRLSSGNTRRVRNAHGEEISWSEVSLARLAALLEDDRPFVRDRAQQTIVVRDHALRSRGQDSNRVVRVLEEVLATHDAADIGRRAVWTLIQMAGRGNTAAAAAIRKGLGHSNPNVRQVALNGISLHRDPQARDALIGLLTSNDWRNRRAAAEALGRLRDDAAVRPLLNIASDNIDRTLQHAITYALIEIGDAEPLRAVLRGGQPSQRRVALLALDQLNNTAERLRVDELRNALTSDHEALRDTAWWLADRHPEWSEPLANEYGKLLALRASDDTIVGRLAQAAKSDQIQSLLGDAIASAPSTTIRRRALAAMQRSGLKPVPTRWIDPLGKLLESADPELVSQAVAVLHVLQHSTDTLDALLRATVERGELSAQTRLQALAVLAPRLQVTDDRLGFLRRSLKSDRPYLERGLAVDVLAKAPLQPQHLIALKPELRESGPLELKRMLEVYGRFATPELGEHVVAALHESKAASSLPRSILEKELKRYGDASGPSVKALFTHFDEINRDKLAKVGTILEKLETADVRRGQKIFHGTKAACAACHAMGYLGGRLGPDLTRIGTIRDERDLLESILFPSQSLVRSYEPTTVVTSDGKVINGLVRSETPSSIVLALDARKTVEIPLDDIDERRPGTISIMPAGLDQQLTPQQLADLIAFLKAAR